MERICILVQESDPAERQRLVAEMEASGYRIVPARVALDCLDSKPPPTLAEIERRTILAALRACRGNKAAAARRLGVCEKTIYNKLKRYSG